MGMPWTDRVEAVKSYVFDSEGNVAARTGSKRAPGCHTLEDAIKLTRSADPIQQEAALLLIAAVLCKAIEKLEAQPLSTKSLTENDTDVDWQAVWTCAVGPGLELVSSLRLALDDTKLPVITACAKALHALLSCSANESIFGLQETMWPGNKSAFTAPVFRRRTELEEGLIGGGRWKYHARASDLYPETQLVNPLSDTEEDKDSIGDEAAVMSKDVAAGLLRMDILTRIQYILEIEQVRAADEHLLGVVIALSRHSPAAAKAVMKCPRLMDSVIQRFLLTDEDLNGGLRPAHTKAIQLLKILSQASAANCIRFAETGALQVAQGELYKQGFPVSSDPRLGEESFKAVCATVVECLRLWRVCVNHQIGIALFPDIYPALCCWLTPLSSKEISSPNSEDMLFLSRESYSLLERLAWTLPVLHTQGLLHTNWTWKVALPLVETASGWLSKDRIAAVNKELVLISKLESDYPERAFRVKLMATIAAVCHFLSTVCQMLMAEYQNGSTHHDNSLHPVVRQLAVALASNNLLTFRSGEDKKGERPPSSMMEIMLALWGKVDDETAMAVVCCIHGLVRLLAVTDQLYQPLEPKSGSPHELEILTRGLVASADGELRELLTLFGNEVIENKDIKAAIKEGTETVSGPAPGLGLGWGQAGGGFWSKRGLLVNGVARMVVDLLEMLPFGNQGDKSELMWRISCCLCVAGVFGPGDGDMVHRVYSNVLLHSDTVALVLQGVVGSAGDGVIQNGSHNHYENISKVLQEHYKQVWVCAKPGGNKSGASRKKKLKTSLIASQLSNLIEESAKLAEEKVGATEGGLANDMVAEWAKQRMPLPAHCVFSPMAINVTVLSGPECKILDNGKFVLSQDGKQQTEMEEAIECGVAWLLGLELLSQSLPSNEKDVFAAIPIVRKVHSLSSLFLLGGEVFLRKPLQGKISQLQRLYARQLDAKTSPKVLDFEGEIGEGYGGFVEALVKKFSNAASPGAEFGAQVALYLRQDVAGSIRLQTWRALSAAQSLAPLPPLSECPGDPSGYLFPSEKNPQMIEALVSAWTSGTLTGGIVDGTKTSVASALALHHIAAFLFEEKPATDEKLQRKIVKTLFDTPKRRPQSQDLLRKLVECSLSWPVTPTSSGELERRLSFMQTACEGDDAATNQVRELRGVLFQSTLS